MKTCSTCKQDKPLKDFPVNRTKPDGHTNYCKGCKKEYNAAYYIRTKDRHNPARTVRRRENRQKLLHLLIEYLQAHPCVVCGERNIVVLDFDHQRDKSVEINQMIEAGTRWDLILLEIEKCEVVCANDHRRRTAASQGWLRAQSETHAPVAQSVRASLS
jgi:hypothetical protein